MIEIKNLCLSYKDKTVLKNINLSFKPGQTVVIMGPSGSGKSTLLKCINFLEEPNEGEVIIDGQRVTHQNAPAIRENVSMVFQNFNLFNHFTILQNLMYSPVKLKKLTKEEALKKAKKLLKRVGLADKLDAYPHQLSGGQKQRAAISRTLMMDPKAILFDEPTSALDAEMVQEVLSVIRDLVHTGMTILLVTHEISFAKSIADRVLFMEDGQVIEDEDVTTFFKSPKSDRAKKFLEHFNKN